ncbi:hypothetical protein CPB84DRAFT_636067 [Gymnopilus junonius]|uniref:GATA-type domain-containing protein n=1 Tax=Gymnopilus junonius TaxID=109634 RepID=A0A9P5NQ09_GYMJU|nr:hypothetical protein CPB84DRAFT_636067 [Gymnopilus junonius]
MTSAHQHHPRYSLHPPPQNSQSDFRLPSLKDLNFQYRSPNGTAPAPQPVPSADLAPAQQDHPSNSRHVSAWSRPNPPSNPPPTHQQLTPPLSAGHENTLKVEYPSKHENGGYVHPGMPLSAQITSVQGSVNMGNQQRTEEPPHSPNQAKRPRNSSSHVAQSREPRSSHATYAHPQYTSYPPAQPPANSPYHQVPASLPGPPNHSVQPAPPPPPPHEQIHHHPMPVAAHPNYAPPYQYMPPRASVIHQQHPPQPTHSNPYPSPGPPPSAPPPQDPWGQQPQHPPPHQHPPPPQPPQQHVQQPPPHMQSHHQQTPAPIPTNPPYMVPQHHLQHPPSAPPQQPQQHTPQQQHQQQHQHQQQPQPQPQQQQQQQQHQFQQPQQPIPFARTTAIVPTNIDTRPAYPATTSEPERMPSGRADAMSELSNQCGILYNFAHRYAQMQNNLLLAQPSQAELEDMSKRAQHVVRLLEDLRRINNAPEPEPSRVPPSESMQESPDDPRPPKRPWEDISQDEAPQSEQNSFSEQYPTTTTDSKPQSTAEQDMELIRTKRATTTASANGPPGQPKSKYRKRSRATPPGKCHSCNIRETPEWRRGPDGARTLCNACGLHYAKLVRKRDKNGGDAPHIDLETLRASARAADIAEKAAKSKQASRSQQSEPNSPSDIKQQTPQQHHQSTFQLVNVIAPGPDQNASTLPSDPNRAPPPPPQAHSSVHTTAIPPPPWATPAAPASSRVYSSTDHLQHQSFMRSSQHNAPSR